MNEEQIIKLIEKNLNSKFKYDLTLMCKEKRPFGNSGNDQILNDIMDIAGIRKSWTVTHTDELDELRYKYLDSCFNNINEWLSSNVDDFEVKITRININV